MDALTVAVIVASGYLVSFFIVAVDPAHSERARTLVKALAPTLIALPLVGAAWWVYQSGFDPLGGLGDRLTHEAWRLSSVPSITFVWPWILGMLAHIADVLIIIAVFVGAAVAVLTAVGFLISALPTLVALPFLALTPVGRGVLVVVRVPFRALRSIAFFFTRPSAVGKIKRTLAEQNTDVHDTARQVNETVTNEVRRALKTRWWRPSLSLFTSVRHYNALAEHIRSLASVAEETNEYLKKKGKPGDGKET